MRRFVWGLVILLGILHYDFWWWGDRSLVLGILPIGLAYHLAFSVAAGVVWALVIRFAWPERIEAWADQPDQPAGTGGSPR